MSRVVRVPRAERDLDDIWDNVAAHDPVAADRLLDRIEHKLDRLADHPRMGRRSPAHGEDVRSFTAGRYVILYQPTTDGICLIRVLHGARDLAAALDAD